MSASRDPALDEQHLVRYLLGLLPEEETERLDELSVVDDEVAWRLKGAEDDLIDGYIGGTLRGEALKQFESFYLSSPRRRDKVRFARSLRRASDRAAPALEGAAEGPADDQAAARSRQAWQFLAAAAVVLVAFGAVFFQTLTFRNYLDASHKETVAADARARDLEQQLNDQRSSNSSLTVELERARAWATSQAHAPMTALVLMPQTRSGGPIPTLAIAPDIDQVAFELRLETNDFSRYQVALKNPASNEIIWRSAPVIPSSRPGMPSISVAVPGRLLKPQHYSLDLSGLRGSAGAEVVGSYAIEIVPR